MGITGGLSRIFVGDPADFNFTQTAPTAGYSAVALRTGATSAGGAKLYEVTFHEGEASYKDGQSTKGYGDKWEHTLEAQLPQRSQALTVFLMTLSAAGNCCGILVVMEFNDGTIFVIGERYVNGNQIPKFRVKMNGTNSDSGKVFDDFNGTNLVLKADYSRQAFEFIGGIAAIEALL